MNEPEASRHPAGWDVVCAVLTEDLSERMSVVEMRALMHRAGARLARRLPLGACATLPELECSINRRLAECRLGEVRILDRDDAIVFQHQGGTLDAVLGIASRPWAPALLEGAYEQWMRSAGAGRALEVCQRATGFNEGVTEFHLRAVASVA